MFMSRVSVAMHPVSERALHLSVAILTEREDRHGRGALTRVQEDLEEEGDVSSGASPDYSAWWDETGRDWDEMLPAP